jgi:hypothetical protein
MPALKRVLGTPVEEFHLPTRTVVTRFGEPFAVSEKELEELLDDQRFELVPEPVAEPDEPGGEG